MLLGPGKYYLETRQKTQLELVEIGYKRVVIMEQIMDRLTDRSLDDKFNRIITIYAPRLYIAFFHNDAKMDGVTFELGWLCHMYHSSGLNNNLRILLEPGYDWKQTTPYVPSLLPGVSAIEFDDSKPYSKASELIHKCVLNLPSL
jgi:hypothetical protein